ncbi:DUF1819 family protein [Lacticaseibacillus camelliae]|uniref:Inner membrane protein (DUF1819) n=1 Tax=Lacticaseibacillus camelliae DSM 22697 = JCM 13995 TaxID=1423730 RepID=A0A0R2F3H3_9LACO|nr:DUF1819 family protein [Lacticaseibacillus camelliae]KRN19468.1 hypothetical protein FC75_GL000137 [Lacticaseibacillus camelliae DSM 22697 = JCM 13995]
MASYSAGAVKYPFWFYEFKQAMEWLDEGETWDQIQSRIITHNWFKLTSKGRRQNLYSQLTKRVMSLTDPIYSVFFNTDTDNQRLIDLIGLMNTNLLFKTFILRTYRDELMMGDQKLEDFEIQAFFRRLQAEDEKVAKWQDETIDRLAGTFRNYLRQAGLAKLNGSTLLVTRPLLDPALEDALVEVNHQDYVAALTGR